MSASSVLRWHGGKSYLAKRIVELMPPHTRYCEPFFGGGAVLFARNGEGVAEYANDLNWQLSNFWAVLREPTLFEQFHRTIEATPFSESAFDWIANVATGVPSAVMFFVRNRQSRQGLGRDFSTPTSRLRRGMNEQVSAWLSAIDGLPEVHARLRRVEIRNSPAIEFIRELDSTETFFYCDPPYMHGTRTTKSEYGDYEMSDAQHAALLDCLCGIKGKFLLSGYPSDLYTTYAERGGWRFVDIDNKASGKRTKDKKIERLWMNYPEAR